MVLAQLRGVKFVETPARPEEGLTDVAKLWFPQDSRGTSANAAMTDLAGSLGFWSIADYLRELDALGPVLFDRWR